MGEEELEDLEPCYEKPKEFEEDELEELEESEGEEGEEGEEGFGVCSICCSKESEDRLIKCLNDKCSDRICEECFTIYLNFCKTENTFVKCTNKYCKCYIVSRSIKRIDLKELYQEVIENAFDKDDSFKDFTDKINEMVEELKKERRRFIEKFPAAIQLIIDVALRPKQNAIDKKNKEYIKRKMNNEELDNPSRSGRICMNSHCDGKLDIDFKCYKCDTEFCKKCERVLKKDHECSTADLENMEFVKNMPRCPKCKVAVEKSEGCNFITCSVCKTDFHYLTGKFETLGSHGKNKMLEKRTTKYNFDFKDKYAQDISSLLAAIEQMEPIVIMPKILKDVEKYLIAKSKYMYYVSICNSIEEAHIKEKISIEYLEDIIAHLK